MQTRPHKRRITGRNRMNAPASKTRITPMIDPLTSLRARIREQIRQWEAQWCELRDRADSIEADARARADALSRQLRSQYAPVALEPIDNGHPLRAATPDAAVRARTSQWQSELDELRAGAFRADSLARHAYQHELRALLISIEACRRDWQRELNMLHASPEQFWEDALNGDLSLTWQQLTRLSDANGDTWPGFGANVEQALGPAARALTGEERDQH
ncbi:MAG: hypothetical protein M1434_01490 [Chloroflexi bacterium]|nr:hypothetical protein [Chloroflexota bacterium]MCL5273404.1 hypothetical protein [Chloroflexota bacterium]